MTDEEYFEKESLLHTLEAELCDAENDLHYAEEEACSLENYVSELYSKIAVLKVALND